MSKKVKLIERFLTMPSDFHFSEVVKLLSYLGYVEMKTGKTSGSRIKFINDQGDQIRFHKPHPTGIMKRYQLKGTTGDSERGFKMRDFRFRLGSPKAPSLS